MRFEFSCIEILEAIAERQKRLDREYARAEEQERLNLKKIREQKERYSKLPFWKKVFTPKPMDRPTTLRPSVPSTYYAELQTIKTLLQTQPQDKIYSLTVEECVKYGLVGVNKQ